MDIPLKQTYQSVFNLSKKISYKNILIQTIINVKFAWARIQK